MLYLYVMQTSFTERRTKAQEVTMNELKRCLQVFTHSPFKVRLMLIGMLCDLLNGKKEQDKPGN